MLLDSGASVTIVNRNLVDAVYGITDGTVLRTADCNPLELMGRKKCYISIGGMTALVDVFVSKNNLTMPCILGVDALRALNVVLNFERQRASVRECCIGNVDMELVDTGDADGEQKRKLLNLLKEHEDLFQPIVPGAAKDVVHRIEVSDHEPFACRQKRIPLVDQKLIDEHVEQMLKDGVISPSQSPYRSPIVMASKKDGTKRFCINFCRLNAVTVKNRYPLPHIDDLVERTKGSRYFCVLDMSSAYWQVPLAEEDRPKTAFSTPSGHYQFNVMAFGLCNAPATQQESMRRTLQGIHNVDVLLDDVIIHDSTMNGLLGILRKVFQRLRERNLKLKMKKCHFMKSSVKYLGYIINGEGRHVDPEKTEVIQKYPVPTSVAELKTFLGISTFCRRFVKDFAMIAAPLYYLTRKGVIWNWTNECQLAFEKIKQVLISPPVLMCPDISKPYCLRLYTDASGRGMGAVLCQEIDGVERTIAYASQHFNEREMKYSTIEKEAAAVVWGISHFQPYLKGAKFRILSDHAPLKWLYSRVDAQGRLGRWQLRLLECDGLEGVEHIKGNENTIADGLSRMPEILVMDVENRNFSSHELKGMQEKDKEFEKIRNKLQQQHGVWTWENRVFIPKVLRGRVLKSYHGVGIHFGIQKTVDVMKPVVYWPRMDQDVKAMIEDCDICKIGKSNPKVHAPLQEFPAPGRPFQRIAMDFAGPFPETKNGNRYFLVIVDHFSKFVKVFPVHDCTMENAIRGLKKTIFEEGVPEEILTDQGTHFTGGSFQNFLKGNQIRHLRTSPYHPQTDGLAERQMRTIKDLVRCGLIEKLNTKGEQWDEDIERIAAHLNQTIHRGTGKTPFSIARGRSGTFRELRWMSVKRQTVQENERWDDIRKRIDHSTQLQREKKGGVMRTFQIGENVWKKVEKVMGLRPRATGPFVIRRKRSHVNYEIENPKTKERKVVHVDKLLRASENPALVLLPSPRGRPLGGR